MLTNVLGIRLVLLLGEKIPRPAPYEVSNALSSVEVTNDAEQGDGFQMSFTLSKDKTGDYGLLRSGALDPFTRVVIGVLLGATPEVLIDGVITHHQIAPSNDPGMSAFTVTGKDISAMLDLKEKNDSYVNQPDHVIVMRVIESYAQYGFIPRMTPTKDVPNMLRQNETDLKLIQRLAQKNGFVFYIEPLTFGENIAYWGPESRTSEPQSALSMNMGTYTNLKSLSFSLDALAPVSTEGKTIDPNTRQITPVSPQKTLREPPLAKYPTQARRIVQLRDTANKSSGQAATTATATVTRAPDSVTGEGELDTMKYGSILRARKLVGVRGIGYSYDGNYYVRRVTHSIKRGDYMQKFSLSREGIGALSQVVRP